MGKYETWLKQLGRNIKAARTKQGLRQRDIEQLTGITYRHYQDIEAGKVNVSVKTLYSLCEIYKTEVHELVKVT